MLYFDQLDRPTKAYSESFWLICFHPIWMKFGMWTDIGQKNNIKLNFGLLTLFRCSGPHKTGSSHDRYPNLMSSFHSARAAFCEHYMQQGKGIVDDVGCSCSPKSPIHPSMDSIIPYIRFSALRSSTVSFSPSRAIRIGSVDGRRRRRLSRVTCRVSRVKCHVNLNAHDNPCIHARARDATPTWVPTWRPGWADVLGFQMIQLNSDLVTSDMNLTVFRSEYKKIGHFAIIGVRITHHCEFPRLLS